MSSQTMKYCPTCGAQIAANSQMCPKCGAIQPTYLGEPSRSPEEWKSIRRFATPPPKKLTAGICALFLGSFGVHKFVLGMTTPGVIMVVVTLFTCVGGPVMWLIGIIEGIIYLDEVRRRFLRNVHRRKEALVLTGAATQARTPPPTSDWSLKRPVQCGLYAVSPRSPSPHSAGWPRIVSRTPARLC